MKSTSEKSGISEMPHKLNSAKQHSYEKQKKTVQRKEQFQNAIYQKQFQLSFVLFFTKSTFTKGYGKQHSSLDNTKTRVSPVQFRERTNRKHINTQNKLSMAIILEQNPHATQSPDQQECAAPPKTHHLVMSQRPCAQRQRPPGPQGAHQRAITRGASQLTPKLRNQRTEAIARSLKPKQIQMYIYMYICMHMYVTQEYVNTYITCKHTQRDAMAAPIKK